MVTEAGHEPNRCYIAQDGSLHLNGAALYNAAEEDVAGALGEGDLLVRSASVTITAAQLKALAATPITLVAAPGAGKYLQFVGAELFLDKGATAYDDAAADGDLVIRYTDGSGQVAAVIEADAFIDAAADAYRWANPNDALDGDQPAIVPVANAALVLDNDGAEFTTGDGLLKVRVLYRAITAQT